MRISVCLVALLLGCGPDFPEPKQATGVAAEMDPGAVTPVWKTLPENVRKDIEGGVAKANAVEQSRSRLERDKLGWDLDDELTMHTRLRGMLEALAMLEPVAFGPASKDKDEAETLLLRFWSAAHGFSNLSKAVEVNGQVRGDAALDPATLQQLYDASQKQSLYFTSRVLRHSKFEAEELAIAAGGFESNEDLAHAQKLWAEITKRGADKITARDWLQYARVSTALEDTKTADDALARARASTAPKSNDEADQLEARKLSAAVKAAERHRKLVDDLRARAKGTGVDADLAKADLLVETGRPSAAKPAYEALAKQYPDDARVRLRRSQQIFADFGQGRSIFDAADKAYEYLHRPGLQNEDAELSSWSLGLTGTIGMQLLAVAGNQPDPKAYLRDKFPGLLVDLGKANAALAKHDAGRAAVNQFLLEHTSEIVRATEPESALVKAAPTWVAEVRKLIAQYPNTEDAYRVYFAMAPFAGNEALAIVTTKPPVNEDDASLFVQRANVASMMAALLLTKEWIDLAQKTADEIPPTDDDGSEGMREALRGDATSLVAMQEKSVDKWRTATRLYEVARDHAKTAQKPRILNNLGFALQSQGLSAEAMTAWENSAKYQAERKWVPILNAGFVQQTDKTARLAFLTELMKAFATAKRDVPALVRAWSVDLSDPPEKQKEAKLFVEGLEGSILRIPRTNLGLELDGNFNLRMGATTSKRSHVLDVSFGATVWLAPTPSIDQAAIKKLAGPPAPPTKK